MLNPDRVTSIPLVVDINTKSVNDITEQGSYIRNGQVDSYLDNRVYVTQRPSILLSTIASASVTAAAGRGIYFWDDSGEVYLVNSGEVYKGAYSSIGSITAGIDKVHFDTLNNLLIIIDNQNNKGWTVSTADSLAQITDTDFPTDLAGGVAVLDGFTFVMDSTGSIYQSDLGDPTTWNALNFIEAEREPDQGVFIARHYDSIVAVGRRTVEFFYNKANPTGSVLGRREDIYYRVGGATPNGFVTNGSDLFFIGTNETGNIGAYTLQDYKLDKVSTTTIDRFLTNTMINMERELIAATQTIGGKDYYFVTVCQDNTTSYTPELTLVFDNTSKLWHVWETTINGHIHFPVVQTTVRASSTPQAGQGIFLNGDVYQPRYVPVPQDTTNTSSYFVSGYVKEEYSASGTTETSSIVMDMTTYPLDHGGRFYKFMHVLELLCDFDQDDVDENITLSISDNGYRDYRDYTLSSLGRRKLTRLGRFSRRNFKVSYNGNRTLRLEKLEAVVDNGEH